VNVKILKKYCRNQILENEIFTLWRSDSLVGGDMIDWARITELRDEIGEEGFEEVVELFLIEVEERLETLNADKNLQELEEDMHFLKGSALNLGFDDLAALCHEGEKRAAAGESVTEAAFVHATYEASKQTFLKRLAKDQAA
jgi:HPt (histidine-containing phosphotransfer) domain-containing protein